MNYFPHPTPLRPALPATKSAAPAPTRDILWNRPLFKAPALMNPRVAFDPLPFTELRPVRVTRRD